MMAVSPPVYVTMTKTNRLTKRQMELVLRVLSHCNEAELLSSYDKRDYRRGLSKLADAWRRSIVGSDLRDLRVRQAREHFKQGGKPCNSNGSADGLSADTDNKPQQMATARRH